MAKKIYDVKPPKIARKTPARNASSLADAGGEKPSARPNIGTQQGRQGRRAKESQPVWVPVSIGAAVVLLITLVYLFFTLPKATIQIWPKVDTLSYQQKIIADKSVDLVDIDKGIIPAKYFEASKTASQDFPATGNASNEGLASGTITVFNKINPPTPLTLKAGTHFMSDSGKIFVALQKIVIPAAKKSGSKITPGSIDVKIQAVEGGDSYNIAPSTFIVPGLKGTAYYYSISATSAKAMAGGYAGKVKKVTDDDIMGAKDVLIKKVADDASSALKSQIPQDYVLLEGAASSNVISASTQTKSGTIADKFTYSATVKASALAFKKSDADQFAKNYIISQLPNGKTLLDSSYKINYSAGQVDISGGKETLNLDFSSGVYQNIDRNSMTLSIIGENANQINQTISDRMGENVSKLKINFWPFWVTSAPNNQKAVNVELKFQ